MRKKRERQRPRKKMTTHHTNIARPYAKAAFSIAMAAHQLSFWTTVLRQLALAVQDEKMKTLLGNPCVTSDELSEMMCGFLHQICGNGSANGEEKITNFVKLLIEKKRLSILPMIADLFQALVAAHEGYMQVTVTSAFALDDHKKQSVQQMLETQLNSKVVAEFDVNSDLIGGFLVRAGNKVLDGSVQGKLARLKSVLV